MYDRRARHGYKSVILACIKQLAPSANAMEAAEAALHSAAQQLEDSEVKSDAELSRLISEIINKQAARNEIVKSTEKVVEGYMVEGEQIAETHRQHIQTNYNTRTPDHGKLKPSMEDCLLHADETYKKFWGVFHFMITENQPKFIDLGDGGLQPATEVSDI